MYRQPLIRRSVTTILVSTAGMAFIPTGGALASSQQVGGTPAATATRTLSVHDQAALRLTSQRGLQTLSESGRATGTIPATISLKMTISYTHAKITFTAQAHGGTLQGRGETTYFAAGSTAHFTGSLTIMHGTGTYAHASGHGLRIQGVEQRSSYALSFSVTGSLSL